MMNALNHQQEQQNVRNNSWIQEWLDEAHKNSVRMSQDEAYRQEVAKRATCSGQDIQAIVREEIAKSQARKAKQQAQNP